MAKDDNVTANGRGERDAEDESDGDADSNGGATAWPSVRDSLSGGRHQQHAHNPQRSSGRGRGAEGFSPRVTRSRPGHEQGH